MSHRNSQGLWYAFWSRPTLDYNDGKELWATYVVYPSSQRGVLEPYTGWPRDIREYHNNLKKDQRRLTTLQAHDDLHNHP